jgi:hypothetical protein
VVMHPVFWMVAGRPLARATWQKSVMRTMSALRWTSSLLLGPCAGETWQGSCASGFVLGQLRSHTCSLNLVCQLLFLHLPHVVGCKQVVRPLRSGVVCCQLDSERVCAVGVDAAPVCTCTGRHRGLANGTAPATARAAHAVTILLQTARNASSK